VTPVLLAAASAAVWGTADFCGGKAARRGQVVAVTLLSKLISVPLVVVLLLASGGGGTAVAGVGWGAAAGLFGILGLILLYRGLATGAMAVVAPVTAVTAAVLPLGAGLLLDRWPSPLELVGVVCAVVAIALVSLAGGGGTVTSGLIGTALLAGSLFGLFFVFLERAGDDAGLWPLAGAQVVALLVCAALVRHRRAPLRLHGATLGWALAAGALDMAANTLYLVATHGGLLSVVAPIGALYPASTVLLSVAVDRERVRAPQFAGLGLAAAALVLVAA
jgi:drug/metabolite transporter (DMT)-like permease